MKEKRSLFDVVFGKKQKEKFTTQLQLLNGFTPTFSNSNNGNYDNDVVRAAVDSIARNAAKLKPRHIKKTIGNLKEVDSDLQYLLATRPNPFMSSYDFYYKIITQMYIQNNAFVYIQRDEFTGKIIGLYPVLSSTAEFVNIKDDPDIPYMTFRFSVGKVMTVAYSDLIHLRRFFYKDDLLGEINDSTISPSVSLLDTMNDGITNAIKSSAYLRGILKFSSMLKRTDMAIQAADFVSDYMGIANQSGVAAIDSKVDFIPINSEPKFANAAQMAIPENKIYKYFGTNENIVMSRYDENGWNAFYESVLEPIAIQMSLEFTAKTLTKQSQAQGNEIVFEANRLQYASNTTKILLVNTLMTLGLLTQDEAREVFNLGALVDGTGSKRLISLNYVDSTQQNNYQVGNKGVKADGEQKEGTTIDGTESGSSRTVES